MHTLLFVYALGACIVGMLGLLFTYNEGYVNHMYDLINEAKYESSYELTEDEHKALNEVNNDTMIIMFIFTSSLFSWFGLIFLLSSWFAKYTK